ncbi:GNAT family N-acetyltransferase [Seonamhaeicola sp. ML3]|uniref:GNAT family N-acetyltransferase n=1 Tax=Seonamhaeicola sp. ML3 TaxID=2937786 RepID=UPI00200E8729|nr:GNAT family N-acetyltransferase [Seonamhaeicola sp. ML3]
MGIDVLKANSPLHIKTIADIARVVWREHYIPIIGENQVAYMLKMFQSQKAIEKQIVDGYGYYLLYEKVEPIGYFSVKKEKEALFLSKFYILEHKRGKGIGRFALDFIEDLAKQYELKNIRLTVNINNSNTISAYTKMGFKKARPIVIDIGNGFVMDDFEMIFCL